jgi:DNA-directed RNA polymerase subunit RPC12/RpoP
MYKCPKCGAEGMAVSGAVRHIYRLYLDADGMIADERLGDYEFDSQTEADCTDCGFTGVVADFEVDEI